MMSIFLQKLHDLAHFSICPCASKVISAPMATITFLQQTITPSFVPMRRNHLAPSLIRVRHVWLFFMDGNLSLLHIQTNFVPLAKVALLDTTAPEGLNVATGNKANANSSGVSSSYHSSITLLTQCMIYRRDAYSTE